MLTPIFYVLLIAFILLAAFLIWFILNTAQRMYTYHGELQDKIKALDEDMIPHAHQPEHKALLKEKRDTYSTALALFRLTFSFTPKL